MEALGVPNLIGAHSTEREESIEVTSDPRGFFERFRESSEYQEAHDTFFLDKDPPENVTLEEKRVVFEESSLASSAMIGFSKKHLSFKYVASSYPPKVVEAVDEYVSSVKDLLKATREGYNVEALDSCRSAVHNILGKAFVEEDMVPTNKLGRALGRLILIDLRLDTFDSASRSDIQRLKYKYGR